MDITIVLEPVSEGYLAKIDKLPAFTLKGPNKNALLITLPEALRQFISQWESEADAHTATYEIEFPTIQRIKSRGFYQSTLYRFQELIEKKQLNKFDLELIHCMQRTTFDSLIA